VHHRGLREGLGEPDDLRVVLGDIRDEPLPELHGLGVRVVDPEQGHAVVDPDLDDPAHLGVGAGRVVVEVQRVDVLVLLRWVLRIRDRAVGPGGEPLRVGLDVGVVRGGLEGDVDGDLEPVPASGPDEQVEVVERPEVGVDRVVPTVGRADRVRAAGVGLLRVERVVLALAGGRADGVDRGQVDDVEAHRGHRPEPFGRGAQRARPPLTGLGVEIGALGPGEDLVPGAVERPLALDEQGVCR
jgi:hypothetical protein